MNVIKNRYFACIVMVLAIVLSIGVNCYTSFSKMYNNLDTMFYGESDGAIQIHLNNKATAATKMANIAKKYIPASSSVIADVTDSANAVLSGGSISEKYDQNTKLTNSVDNLYYEMNNADSVANYDLNELNSQYKVFNTESDEITKSSYNQKASEYNTALSKFPPCAVKAITNLQYAQEFK